MRVGESAAGARRERISGSVIGRGSKQRSANTKQFRGVPGSGARKGQELPERGGLT